MPPPVKFLLSGVFRFIWSLFRRESIIMCLFVLGENGDGKGIRLPLVMDWIYDL